MPVNHPTHLLFLGLEVCRLNDMPSQVRKTWSDYSFKHYSVELSLTALSLSSIFVSITGNRLSSDFYYKPTDSHSYLDCTSSRPISYNDTILYSQFPRLSSQGEALRFKTYKQSSFVSKHAVTDGALTRVSSVSRSSVLALPFPRGNKDSSNYSSIFFCSCRVFWFCTAEILWGSSERWSLFISWNKMV